MNMLEGMPQRQAALLLHALSEFDRAWVLAALPEQDNAQLTALLQELRDMDVSPDPSWLAQWLPATRTAEQSVFAEKFCEKNNPDARPSASKSRSELIALKPHQVSELARLLSAEPVELTLRLLRVQPWPWREKLLSQMTASAQMRLRQSLRDRTADSSIDQDPSEIRSKTGHLACHLDQALIEALARRMARSTVAVAAEDNAANDGKRSLLRSLMALWRNLGLTPARAPL